MWPFDIKGYHEQAFPKHLDVWFFAFKLIFVTGMGLASLLIHTIFFVFWIPWVCHSVICHGGPKSVPKWYITLIPGYDCQSISASVVCDIFEGSNSYVCHYKLQVQLYNFEFSCLIWIILLKRKIKKKEDKILQAS